jgi:hypothetical protein
MTDIMTEDPGGVGPSARGSRVQFAQGSRGDQAKPGAWQLLAVNGASGPDGSCPGTTDNEALGLLGQWDTAASWVESRKLAVARELIRRYASADAGADAAPGALGGTPPTPGLPAAWDDDLVREVSLQLDLSIPGARSLLDFAWSLEARLPGIGQALSEGRIKPGRARMIAEETDVLDDPAMLAEAEQMILAGCGKCKTWADLRRLVQRAVCTVDPDGARKRREQEERERARVRFWREAAGTCALSATGLPTDESLAAYGHVEQRAQAYRKAGIKRPIDILRVAAYLDLLNLVPAAGRIARFRAEDASQAAEQAGPGKAAGTANEKAGTGRPSSGGKPGSGTSDGDTGGRPADGTGTGTGTGTASAGTDSGDAPRGTKDAGDCCAPDGFPWNSPADDGFPAAEDPCGRCSLGDCLCRDWVQGEPPCEDCGYSECRCSGPASSPDPDPASDIPGTGSPGTGSPGTGSPGTRSSGTGGSGDGTSSGGSAPDPGASFASEVNLTLRHLDIPLLTALGLARRPGEARTLGALDPALARSLAEAAARHPGSTFCLTIVNADGHAVGHGCCKPVRKAPPGTGPPARDFTITPSGKPGPPGGYGSWLLTLPGRDREYTVDLHPVPTGECGHQYEAAGHDPGQTLRHLVHVRDGKCGFPTCSRHARESDFEHCAPFEDGGRTCGCNCWAASRSCHQLKQRPGWSVREVRPGYHQWETPSGRIHVQEPWRYPA